MISCSIREQHRYTPKELFDLLCLSEEKAIPVIKRLKNLNIVKAVKKSDVQREMTELSDEDIAVCDVNAGENELYYVFTFVGLITIAGRVLRCFPKYLSAQNADADTMRTIVKVLEKYDSRKQMMRMFTEENGSQTFNQLAVMLALINDYSENGLYSNPRSIIETNGNGEILWERTINDSFAMLCNDRPYYMELETSRRVQDEYDYFRRLHACVITMVSRELEQASIAELFELATAELTDEEIDDFGDTGYILERIEKELNVEFNTRKQIVLKTMYIYLSNAGHLSDTDCFAMYGTNSFNLVWEDVCGEILDDMLHKPLNSLPVQLSDKYEKNKKLIEIIEKPIWSGEGFSHTAVETLIPDTVTISGSGSFLIFDAKYYIPQIERGKPLRGQPGIESITKQYLYQLAYSDFIRDCGLTDVKNCFLMPTEGNCVIDAGTASLPMLDAIGLQKIQVRYLPTQTAYMCYLEEKKLDPSFLRLN